MPNAGLPMIIARQLRLGYLIAMCSTLLIACTVETPTSDPKKTSGYVAGRTFVTLLDTLLLESPKKYGSKFALVPPGNIRSKSRWYNAPRDITKFHLNNQRSTASLSGIAYKLKTTPVGIVPAGTIITVDSVIERKSWSVWYGTGSITIPLGRLKIRLMEK